MNQESMKVHDLRNQSAGEVYDETQCNDDIRTGDVLLTDEGIGIMMSAWPVMVFGTSESLHTIDPMAVNASWEDIISTTSILERHPDMQARMREGLLVAWAIACG